MLKDPRRRETASQTAFLLFDSSFTMTEREKMRKGRKKEEERSLCGVEVGTAASAKTSVPKDDRYVGAERI